MDKLNEQFGRIYDENIDKIYRFVYLKVNSQEIAEDITSKVFLKGWEAYQNRKEIANPSAFLYQIARNSVIDHYREKGRANVVSVEVSGDIMDQGADIYNKAVLSADVDKIKGAMQGIKQEYQDIIIWHYLEDMPIAEIAKLTGKPAGTVRVALHRGLKELKNLVQEA